MSGYLLGALIVLGWVIYYVSSCLFWPYAPCWRCKGNGRFGAWWGGRAWRRCWWCKGSGDRKRIGRKAWDYYARLRRDAR